MALSNNHGPKDAITAFQVLLNLAHYLKVLQDDPCALEKAAKAAYELPAEEQAKAQKAREDIAHNQKCLEENRKKQKEIADSMEVLERKEHSIVKVLQEIKEKEDKLDRYERILEKKEAEQLTREAHLIVRLEELDQQQEKLTHLKKQLEEEKARIASYEEGLRGAAMLMKDITGKL